MGVFRGPAQVRQSLSAAAPVRQQLGPAAQSGRRQGRSLGAQHRRAGVPVARLGMALRDGAVAAPLGVALGLALVSLPAAALGRTGVFRSEPAFLLDGVARLMAIAYDSYS